MLDREKIMANNLTDIYNRTNLPVHLWIGANHLPIERNQLIVLGLNVDACTEQQRSLHGRERLYDYLLTNGIELKIIK